MNISAVNYNKNADNVANINRVAGVQVKGRTFEDAIGNGKIFENTSVAGRMTATRMDETVKAELMNELESVKEQLQVSAQSAKDSLKALFQKMDGSTPVLMDEEGYHLNEMEPQEIVTVVERIQIMLAAYCDDYETSLTNVDSDKIEAVTGNSVSANQIMEKLQQAGIAATKENIDEVKGALNMAEDIGVLNEDEKLYLVANDMELTLDNLFKASYGSNRAGVSQVPGEGKRLTADEWNSLKAQAEKIIARNGMEVNDTTLGYAKTLIENDISVDGGHLKMMQELDELDIEKTMADTQELLDRIVKGMTVGQRAKDTAVTGTPVMDSLKQITDIVEKADYADVAQLTYEEKPFTVAQLKATYTAARYSYTLNESSRALVDSRYEQLLSAKMYLMSGAGAVLAKLKIDFQRLMEKAPVHELAARLQEADREVFSYVKEEQQQVYDVRMAVFKISQSPISVIGEGIRYGGDGIESLTLGAFSGSSWNMTMKVRAAQATYEAVGTEVRKDLKDSLFKAVSASAGSLLENMDMEDSEMNRSAVRILAANQMDVTKENVEKIKQQYSEVKRLIDNMKPQAVLDMIREGLNPMETEISVLNTYLEQHNGEANDEKFSRFLYKLDRHKDITAEERRQFIGIYKMMNIFRKDAGKAVGALENSKAEFTMSNLIAAYHAGKAAGKDVRIDADMGMAQVQGTVKYFDNLFSAVAAKITPDTLQKTNRQQAIAERGVEDFCEAVDNYYDRNVEGELLQGYVKQLKERADDAGISYLLDKAQGMTLDNIMAVHELLVSQGGSSFMKKLAPELQIDYSEEALQDAYEHAADLSDEELRDAYEPADMDYEHFERLRMQNKEIHLMAGLAKRHDYHIPYEENDRIGMIHLQVVDGEEKGKASVRITRPSGKEAVVEIAVSDKQLRLYGLDSADGDGMKKALERVAASETVQDMGFNTVKVTAGESAAIPHPLLAAGDTSVKNSTLFMIAREVVHALGI